MGAVRIEATKLFDAMQNLAGVNQDDPLPGDFIRPSLGFANAK